MLQRLARGRDLQPMTVPKGIDADRVTHWLTERVPGIALPLRYSRISGGHSNLTYEVVDAVHRRLVLRRSPLGAVLATAHDIAREYRIIAALGPTIVPVAPTLALCEDVSVNGAAFYAMKFVEGDVLDSADAVETCVPTARGRSLGEHVIDILATLHAIDPATVGLADLGRREAYLERQLKRWTAQLEQSRSRELPTMNEVQARLRRKMPKQQRSTIVHGELSPGKHDRWTRAGGGGC